MFVKRSQDYNSTPSTFTFAKRYQNLDWHALNTPQIISTLENSDIETLQPVIQNFTFAELNRGDLEYFKSSGMIQVFKLTQLGIEYLIHSQDRLLAQNNTLRQNYDSLVNYEAGVKDHIMKNEREIEQLELKLRDKKKTVGEIESVIKEPKTAKGLTKALVRASAVKCPYCPKHFISGKYKESHVKRRHGDLVTHKLEPVRKNESADMNNIIHSIQRMISDQIQSINQIHSRDIQALTGSFQKQLNELSAKSTESKQSDSALTQDMKELLTQTQKEKEYFASLLDQNTQKLQHQEQIFNQIQQANLTLSLQKQKLEDQLQCLTSADFLTFNTEKKFSTGLNLSKTDSLAIQPRPGTPQRSITSLPFPIIQRPNAPHISSLTFVDYSEDVEEFPTDESRTISIPIVTPREPRSKLNVGIQSKESLNPLLMSDMSGYEGEYEDTPSELLLTRRFSPWRIKRFEGMIDTDEDENPMISIPDEQMDYTKLRDAETQQTVESKTPLLTQYSRSVISLTPADLRGELSDYHIQLMKEVNHLDTEPAYSSILYLDLPIRSKKQDSEDENSLVSANHICITPLRHSYSPETDKSFHSDCCLNGTKLISTHDLAVILVESSQIDHHTDESKVISTSEFPLITAELSYREDTLDSIQQVSSHELIAQSESSHIDQFDESKIISASKLELFPEESSYIDHNLNESDEVLPHELAKIPLASTCKSSTFTLEYQKQDSSKESEEILHSEHSTPEIPLTPAEPTYDSAIETDRENSINNSSYHIEEEVYPSIKQQIRVEIGSELATPEAIEISGISEICITREDKLKFAAEMIGLNWEDDIRYRYLVDDFIEATQDYDVLTEDNPILEQYRNYFQDLKQNHEDLYTRSMNILSDEPRYVILMEKYNEGLQTYFEHNNKPFKQMKRILTSQLKSNTIELKRMKNSSYKRYERRVNMALDLMIEEMLNSIHLKLPISNEIQKLLETISEKKETSFSSLLSDYEEEKQENYFDSNCHSLFQTPTLPKAPANHRKLVVDLTPPSPPFKREKNLASSQEFSSPIS